MAEPVTVVNCTSLDCTAAIAVGGATFSSLASMPCLAKKPSSAGTCTWNWLRSMAGMAKFTVRSPDGLAAPLALATAAAEPGAAALDAADGLGLAGEPDVLETAGEAAPPHAAKTAASIAKNRGANPIRVVKTCSRRNSRLMLGGAGGAVK